MKDVFLVYDQSCFYEIITLSYFMSFSGCDVILCSPDGQSVKTMEGYSVNVDMAFSDIPVEQVRSFIIPGGKISSIDNQQVWAYLQALHARRALICGICAGVDVLDHSSILAGLKSTHSTDLDIVKDGRIITARANAYVDFAIEAAKELALFADETDLQETIDFWKYHRRVQ